MVRVNGVECVYVPFLPVTVKLYVPFVANRATRIDKVEEPVAVAGFGLKLALVLAGRPLRLRLTELDPPLAVSLIVSLPIVPRVIVTLGDEAEMVKSRAGDGTETEKFVEWVRFPLVPVTLPG